MSRLRVEGLSASFERQPFLHDIRFEVPAGAFHVLLGPSGGGKTTLLRCLAGLHPHSGHVRLDEADVTHEPPERRGIVLLHQEATLFPHLTVHDNIAFGLRLRRAPRATQTERVQELLRLVDLEGFGARRIHALSGGEKQRVSLARALAIEPRVLLLDEPLSALDATLRHSLRSDLRRILGAQDTTVLYVTHDQEEAFALADAVMLLDKGRLLDHGPVARVFDEPASTGAARVLGRRNVLRFRRGRDGLDVEAGVIPDPGPGTPDEGTLMLREEELPWSPDPEGEWTIASVTFLGTRTHYTMRYGSHSLAAESAGAPRAQSGQRVRVAWSDTRPHLLAEPASKTPYS